MWTEEKGVSKNHPVLFRKKGDVSFRIFFVPYAQIDTPDKYIYIYTYIDVKLDFYYFLLLSDLTLGSSFSAIILARWKKREKKQNNKTYR